MLSVLFFHLEYNWIPGGFAGVDIFFVISGFLITGLIWRDIQVGEFSFSVFYKRRIRRLAPALIVTLTATFVVAFVYLTPIHMQRFSGALISSIFSVSNLFFWAESGYFDASADLKPLLHTWSLSVEEQFYLVWPALIVFISRFRQPVLLASLMVIALISVGAAKWFTSFAPSASFFLMPFRVYEFSMGAMLALIPLPLWNNRVKELLTVAGLALIAYSVLQFNSDTPFPDLYALVPCAGATLLIAGGGAQFSGLLLKNPISFWVAKISYSLYLVHWPVIVFYKHITFRDVIGGKSRIALLLVCFLLAGLLYLFAENRFRLKSNDAGAKRNKSAWLWLSAPLLLAFVATHAYALNGWPARFDANVMRAIGDLEERQVLRRQFIEGDQPLSESDFDSKKAINVLVMGDSHSTDMFNALHLNLAGDLHVSIRRLAIDDECFYVYAKPAISSLSLNKQQRCNVQVAAVTASKLLPLADQIILSARWERHSIEHIADFVDELSINPEKVVVMGRTAEFKNVPSMILKNGLNDRSTTILAQNRDEEVDSINELLVHLALERGFGYIDKLRFLCEQKNATCDVVDSDGLLLYTDYGHWTLEGARLFGQRLLGDFASRRLLLGS